MNPDHGTRSENDDPASPDPFGLRGRSAIVVGAGGGGIGTAIAVRLGAAGAHVVAVDVEPAALAAAERAVREAGGRCTGVLADATRRDQVEAVVERASALPEPLHGLVNVAGGLRDRWGRVIDVPEADFDAVLDWNLRSAFLSSQAVGRELLRRGEGGAIVQIASIVALQGMPFGAHYAMSKAGLIALSRSMALEWGRDGVRVNAIAVGSVRVPRNRSYGDEVERDRRVLPLGRQGSPDDIAGAALFLLSELARWITGQVLAVDGGASIKPSYLDADDLPVFVGDGELRRRILGRER